jgi:hypothetical protein
MNSSDLEQQDKFDRELDWCIQKLSAKLEQEKDQKKGTTTALDLLKKKHFKNEFLIQIESK